MSKDLAISIRGVSKTYTIVHNAERVNTLAEAAVRRLKNPMQRPEKETFWALRDVSLDIHQGDVVGVIGRNGSGKSTLLKILSRITTPTRGQIKLFGRVGSLLEVGTGFHPELTGRENIFLNGSILGMKRREIERQFDAIVDFAEVESFLDTPVKRYSSGMYVRLAFAVAAHLNPEILLVDEVLAVGDAQFQQKCLGKMGEVSKEGGRTVLFVSHNMGAVQVLCNSAVVLRNGCVLHAGSVDDCIQCYVEAASLGGAIMAHLSNTDPRMRLKRVTVNGDDSDKVVVPCDMRELELAAEFECDQAMAVDFEVVVADMYDQPMAFFAPGRMDGAPKTFPAGKHTVTRTLKLPLLSRGDYVLNIDLTHPGVCYWARMPRAVSLHAEGVPSATGRILEFREKKGWMLLEEGMR